MLNVVIPLAGAGSRFVKAGFVKPKPFIEVAGKPMVVHVLENLRCSNARYFLLSRKEHMDQEVRWVKEIEKTFDAKFIPIHKPTEGSVCSILYARKYINNDEPLLIANSDQIVDIGIQDFVNDCFSRCLDGSILTFTDEKKDPKWSYARLSPAGLVTEVKEKIVISDYATVGIYLFSKGIDFINATIDMIAENDRCNGEFYTCPTYNYVLRERKKIGIYNIRFDQMHGMGTPEDLDLFLARLRHAN